MGITSDRHWARFCDVFDAPDLAADQSLATNNQRIAAREQLMPQVRQILAEMTLGQFSQKAERAKLPFAHIAQPEQLFDDPHLNAGERLLPTTLPDGTQTKLPALPLEMGGRAPGITADPPAFAQHTEQVLEGLGLSSSEIEALAQSGAIALPASLPPASLPEETK